MRLLRTLLLLLVLPGLLMPAGAALRWCRCAAPVAPAAKACCAAKAPSCGCHGERRAPAELGTPKNSDDRCCCVLRAPDRKPDSTPVPKVEAPPCAVVPPQPAATPIPAPAGIVMCWHEAAWHAPPDRARNLPLLL